MNIRRRIFLGIILLFSIGFYFLITFIADDIELRYRESTEEPLVDAARILATIAAVSTADNNVNIALFRETFKSVQSQHFSAQIFGLLKHHVDLHVYITDLNGIVIFDSNQGLDEGKDYSRWRDVHLTLQGKYGARTSDIDNDEGKKMIYVASPILRTNDLIGVLSVGKPTHSSNQFVLAAQKKLVIAGTAACLIFIGIGLILGLWVTRPIQKLTTYAKAIRDGERVKRPALGSSEMEELGVAFEQMRDALDGKSYIENYVQTLTHEIKSPISAIRGAVELLEEELTPQQKQILLQNIHQESDRISKIVDDLLLLSSLESRKYITAQTPIDVHEMLAEIKRRLLPLLLIRNIELIMQGNTHSILPGDSTLIEYALMNLLQNAIDFSPSKSAITLRVTDDSLGVTFLIRDAGVGIPDYAQDRIFERFYSLNRPENGRKSSGLGLSLVREIALLHQGEISVKNHPERGAIATLFFQK